MTDREAINLLLTEVADLKEQLRDIQGTDNIREVKTF